MAHAICAKSGIQFDIQFFPYNFNEGTLHHPVFDLTYEELIHERLLSKWVKRQFTEIDTKLYFLSLLHSSNLVEFHTYARPSLAVCEMNMESLLDILSWLYTIKHPRLSMPHMAITQDTASLDNVRNWIGAWNNARADFENGYKELTRNQLMMRKEDTLQRLIKEQQKEISQFAGMLAEWASLCAEFPDDIIDVNGVKLSISSYWKQILVTCSRGAAAIWKLDKNDMIELLEHLEMNLEHGSIYAFEVMKLIRDGISTHENYLGNFGFAIVNNPNDIESSNLAMLANNAPTEKPNRLNYNNHISYLRDKIKYEQAVKLGLICVNNEVQL